MNIIKIKINMDSELSTFRMVVGDSPTSRIIEYLIETRELDFSLTDIAEGANVGWTTLHRTWANLERLNLLKHTRIIGNAKLFMLNKESPLAQALIDFYNKVVFNIKVEPIPATTSIVSTQTS